ncbi:hypothetical protein C2S51_030339 [Perilla frutescens var. frutescens]|nr:hypothetical protein C2S51_030339 [Perilla frutescens var. frutescens]
MARRGRKSTRREEPGSDPDIEQQEEEADDEDLGIDDPMTSTDILRIRDDVWTLLDRIGWLQALETDWKTYPLLVKEVLSTLDVKRTAKRGPTKCTFRMGNKDRALTVDEVNPIFRAPLKGIYHTPHRYNKDYAYRLFYFMESDIEKYDSSNAKAFAMPNPVFRYLHRILASTVFARRENNGLRMTELGLITPIAAHFGIDLDEYQETPGSRLLNLNYLRNVKILTSDTITYLFSMRAEENFPLPNPDLTHVANYQERTN